MNPLPSREFTWHFKSYFLWKTMKKYLWISSAAVVIGALKCIEDVLVLFQRVIFLVRLQLVNLKIIWLIADAGWQVYNQLLQQILSIQFENCIKYCRHIEDMHIRALDNREYLMIIFLISHWNHMLLPLVWAVSSRQFRWGVTIYVFMQKLKKKIILNYHQLLPLI